MRAGFRRLRPPHPAADPLIHALYAAMMEQRCGMLDTARRAGVSYATLTNWFNGRVVPNIVNLRAALGVFSLEVHAYQQGKRHATRAEDDGGASSVRPSQRSDRRPPGPKPSGTFSPPSRLR